MPFILGKINLLLFFILQDEAGRFLESCRLLFNEGYNAFEEGSIGICLFEVLLMRILLIVLLNYRLDWLRNGLVLDLLRLGLYLLSDCVSTVKCFTVAINQFGE